MAARSSVVAAGAITGAVVGLLAAAFLFVSFDAEGDADGEVGSESAEAVARDFIDAWERAKLGTYYVRSEFRRETPSGQLVDEIELVQRPPDFIRSQFGNVEARINDAPVSCFSTPDDVVTCTQGVTDSTYSELVADELSRFDGYFTGGPLPLYRIEASSGGCFDLTLTQVFPSPPYGESARFCFDEATGAMRYSQIRQAEATTTTQAVEIRGEVTATDFALPADLEGAGG